METIGERVRHRRAQLGMSQEELAKVAGLKQSDISKIERGIIRRTTAVIELARALQCSPNYLALGEESEPGDGAMRKDILGVFHGKVPLISWVRAGNWSDVNDPFQPGEADDWIDVQGLQYGPNSFALTVNGDSMTSPSPGERTFPEGTLLIVDPSRVATANDFVIAKDVSTQRATFKKLVTDGSRWYLKALNPAYPMIEIDDPSIRIIGKVIEYQFRGRL
jgi:SOS-response transcriptional repressor LexA